MSDNREAVSLDECTMKKLTEIVNKRFEYITTLESQLDDELDFPEVSVWGLCDILIQAYLLGYNAAR